MSFRQDGLRIELMGSLSKGCVNPRLIRISEGGREVGQFRSLQEAPECYRSKLEDLLAAIARHDPQEMHRRMLRHHRDQVRRSQEHMREMMEHFRQLHRDPALPLPPEDPFPEEFGKEPVGPAN